YKDKQKSSSKLEVSSLKMTSTLLNVPEQKKKIIKKQEKKSLKEPSQKTTSLEISSTISTETPLKSGKKNRKRKRKSSANKRNARPITSFLTSPTITSNSMEFSDQSQSSEQSLPLNKKRKFQPSSQVESNTNQSLLYNYQNRQQQFKKPQSPNKFKNPN